MTDATPADLWAAIDALDRELLEVLARRMAVVDRIAAAKARLGLPVRDPARERDLLAARRRAGEALGLPPGEVEAVFESVLRASRERQAAGRAPAARDGAAHTVAVIGGAGEFGALVARLFGELGHRVLVADVDTALTPVEAARQAAVTVVSVPIAVTEEVIRAVGPAVPADGLLMDVTSLKAAPVAAMLASTPASVVGTHPMFGPGVQRLEGQRVVLCRGRGDAWADWLARTLAARGLAVHETTPDAHDRAMALVQVLTHYQTQVFGLTLARLGQGVEATRAFMSPAYLLELYVAARHFAQSPALYGPIEMRNPRLGEVTDAFRAAAAEVAGMLAAGDQARFDMLFAEVRAYFGDFTAEALENAKPLIDRLAVR